MEEGRNLATVTTRVEIPQLSEATMDLIAEKAARRALEIVYAEVGQGVLKKLAWLVGLVVIGLALWLAGKNVLPYRPE